MEQLKLRTPEGASWSYDEESDVLYISLGKPAPSLSLDLGGGILARYVKETEEITGITVLGISKVIENRK